MTIESSTLVCDITALPEGGLQTLTSLSEELFAADMEVRVLPDGYELSYPDASADTLSKLADFIASDRLCCPFIRHGLVVEPYGGITRLQLTGGEGVKEVISADVLRMLRDEVAVVAGLRSGPAA